MIMSVNVCEMRQVGVGYWNAEEVLTGFSKNPNTLTASRNSSR